MNRTYLKVLLLVAWAMLLMPPAYAEDGRTDPGQPIKLLSLDKAVEMALSDSKTIKEAASRYSGAVEEKKSAFTDFLPKLSASYSYTRFDDQPYLMFQNMKIPLVTNDLYHWNLAVVQPIFTGYALSTKYEMAKLNIDLKQVEKQLAILDVTRSVKSAYYTVLLTKKALGVADDAVENLEAHVRDADQFYRHDVIPQNDLLQSQVALANARQNRERARAANEMALSALNMLLGVGMNEPTQIADVTVLSPTFYSLEQLTAAALEKRPELRALRIGLKNADYATRLAKSAFYPEIALVGSYDRVGDNMAASNNPYFNDHFATVTLMAKWHIFEWGKTGDEVRKYGYEKAALHQKLKQAEDNIALEVKSAFLNTEVARKNIQTAATALDQARENYRMTNLQYRHQLATTTNVLDARTFLSQAMTNYYGALYGCLIAEAELERVAGGSLS
ncbi:MAG: TolC family protein [Syntrophorhabdales bacterium]|jgi:outer membrane protein TolC